MPPNDPAQPRRGRKSQSTMGSRRFPIVGCSAGSASRPCLLRGPVYPARSVASLLTVNYAFWQSARSETFMFIIPLPSTQYVSTTEGSIVKDVTCERCGHMYSYRMSRIVSGIEKVLFSSSRGPEKALKKARASLTKALYTECDDIPCPECGWHQPAHIAFVRSRSHPELRKLTGAFFVFAGLALGLVLFIFVLGLLVLSGNELPKASSILQLGLIVLAIASPGVLLRGLRSLLALSYRPNR